MESFGSYIKGERERKGITIEEISRATNITPNVLEALESDRIEDLPALVFVKGFIRNYARYLGLDPNETIESYVNFLSENRGFASKVSVIQEGDTEVKIGFDQNKILIRERSFNRKRLISAILLILLILLVIFLGYRFFSARKKSNFHNGFPHIKYPNSFKKTSTPSQQGSPEHTKPEDEGIVFKNKKRINGETGTDSRINEKKNATEPVPIIKDSTTNIKYNEKEKDRKKEAVSPKKELIITTLETTWIDIMIDDFPSYDLTIEPGRTILLEAEKGFFLTIGNAGGVEIIYNGKDLGAIGKSGEVVRLKLP